MKFIDESQNVRARIRSIHIIVMILLGIIGARLYLLQVLRGEYYSERAEMQRIRLLPIAAPRGVIYDRNGKVLVDSQPIFNIIMSREDVKDLNLSDYIEPISAGLKIDREYLKERFDQIKSQPKFESIRIKESANSADIGWVEAHTLEYPELRIEQQPQRLYPSNGVLAHVLGFVGEISPDQLDKPEYKDKGYKPGDIIGKDGLEATYDNFLRGHDGYRKVLVDSRGQIQEILETLSPQPGQDLVTTIDLDLQLVAEDLLRKTPNGRGVIIAMDPNNDEVFVMASAPIFDPNLFSQRITTKEGRAEYAQLLKDPSNVLLNRAIQGRYPPGSTWKTLMAVGGLEQGAITTTKSNLVCGGGISIGNRFTRCMGGNHGTPDLHYAIMKSCDGYFYRLGLKMGVDGLMRMVDQFDLNKKTGIDLPHEVVSTTPSRELKARLNPRSPAWTDIDTIHAAFGQGTDVLTPIALLRAVSSIGMQGRMYVPHLLKEIKSVGVVGDDPLDPDYRPPRLGFAYQVPAPKIVPMLKSQNDLVVKSMWSVVNDAGTAARIRMAGFDIAGKTGTAQVVGLGKDVGRFKDHSWFVSFAPAYKPEISCVALIENAGFGANFGAPTARAIYDAYYRKTRHQEPPGAAPQIALATREQDFKQRH